MPQPPGYQAGGERAWWWKIAMHLDEAQQASFNVLAHNVEDPTPVHVLQGKIREMQVFLLEIFRWKGLLPGVSQAAAAAVGVSQAAAAAVGVSQAAAAAVGVSQAAAAAVGVSQAAAAAVGVSQAAAAAVLAPLVVEDVAAVQVSDDVVAVQVQVSDDGWILDDATAAAHPAVEVPVASSPAVEDV
jgi:hypothetical protein